MLYYELLFEKNGVNRSEYFGTSEMRKFYTKKSVTKEFLQECLNEVTFDELKTWKFVNIFPVERKWEFDRIKKHQVAFM